jgi:hypothetical protein
LRGNMENINVGKYVADTFGLDVAAITKKIR